jgi:hypothetical protein
MGGISKEVVYEAEYFVDGNMITVYGIGSVKSPQINRMKEESLAQTLLSNLIREGYAEPVE